MSYLFATLLSISTLSGGWNKVDSTNSFEDVTVTKEQHDQLVENGVTHPFWGNIGPKAVFLAWNSAAYDESNNILYFHGGGHGDYGGNEVYSYDLLAQTWTRETFPSSLTIAETHSERDDITVYTPEEGPVSAHTYDTFVWNPATKSIWTSSNSGFSDRGPAHVPAEHVMWEFSPTSKKWTKHPASRSFFHPHAIYVKETQQILIIAKQGNKHLASLFDKDGTEHQAGTVSGLNDSALGSMFSNPETGQLYSAHKQGIYAINVIGNSVTAEKIIDFPALEDLHYSTDYHLASYNYRPIDKKFYIWNGGPQIVTWDPKTNDFHVIWNENQVPSPSHENKGAGRLFDKFVYVKSEDVFIGTMNAADGTGDDGMWAWSPVTDSSSEKANFGSIQVDGVTQTSISLYMPLLGGDKDYNATVTAWFKKTGNSTWKEGIELVRLRPEFVRNTKNSTGISGEGFAGIIDGLDPFTQYDVRVLSQDVSFQTEPTIHTFKVKTRFIPSLSTFNRTINVSTAAEFRTALSLVQPGEEIKLLPGTYSGLFEVSQGGTDDRPIRISGNVAQLVIIDAQSEKQGIQIMADNVQVSDLTVINAETGINLFGSLKNISVTNSYLKQVERGIVAKGGHQNLYIHNNTLEGIAEFGDVSSATWNYEGIVVTGQDIEISSNTLSGFGDSLGMHWRTDLTNKSINIHHNLVRWGGDDAIEFDFSLRNVSVHHNLLKFSANGLSFQPVWGGPAIAHHNIVMNSTRGPIKIKPERDNPSGIYLYNNTFVKNINNDEKNINDAWRNSSGKVKLLDVVNNLFVNEGDSNDYTLNNTTTHSLFEFDFNGWTSNGRFRIKLEAPNVNVSERSFEEWKNESPLGNNDTLLDSSNLFATYTPEFSSSAFSRFSVEAPSELSLRPTSSAIDAGRHVFGVNRNTSGQSPDLGAIELGAPKVTYGANSNQAPPENPIAINDLVSTDMNSAVTFSPLDNDYIPTATRASLRLFNIPQTGNVHLDSQNRITYTPPSQFTGEVEFNYELTDTVKNNKSVGEIQISVTPPNQAPIAVDDTFEVLAGESISFTLNDLLKNDSDPEKGDLTVVSIGSAKNGTLKVEGNNVTYKASSSLLDTEVITYQVSDEEGETTSATIIINILLSSTITGTEYRDVIDLSDKSAGFIIRGLGGSDTLTGSSGDDVIIGGSGQDSMFGGEGDDEFRYDGNNDNSDQIDGGAGYNVIVGNELNNNIELNKISNIDVIDGGAGYDTIMGSRYREVFDFSNIILRSIDIIDAGDGSDTVIGSQANDRFRGSDGNDSFSGQRGQDVVYYNNPKADYNITVNGTVITVTSLKTNEGKDTLESIEHIRFADSSVSTKTLF